MSDITAETPAASDTSNTPHPVGPANQVYGEE